MHGVHELRRGVYEERPSVARTRPSAPTARPPALTARPSAPAGGSRGRRGRALQGGRHRGGQAAWKRGPARGRPTPPLRWEQRRWSNYREGDPARCVCRSACQSLRRSVCQSMRRACAGACAGECARACSRHVSRMPTPLATQAPDDLGLKATLQWERPCGDMGLDTALEGKEPGCGSGWRDRPGTEGTTVGQPTQGREWCFIGLEAAGYPASRHGDFPLRRGLCSYICSYIGAKAPAPQKFHPQLSLLHSHSNNGQGSHKETHL